MQDPYFIRQIDDFLPISLSNNLESLTVNNPNFPWFFVDSSSGANYHDGFEKDQYGFFHILYAETENSDHFKYFLPVVYFIEDKFNVSVDNLMRMRLGMSVKISEKPITRYPHVDTNISHLTLLYYINDSDGDTVIYCNDKKGILKKISPKKNRAVLFDGSIFHSSSTPSQVSQRVALNINFQTNTNYKDAQ